MFVSTMLKKCSDFISTITAKDISNNYVEDAFCKASTISLCEASKSKDHFDVLEDKENLNDTLTINLDQTFEIKDVDMSEDLMFQKSLLKYDLTEFNKTVDTMESLNCYENIDQIHYENMHSDSIDRYDQIWADNSEVFREIPDLPVSKCETVRLSLLTAFDPLYQSAGSVSLLCEEIVNSIVEEVILNAHRDNNNIGLDISIDNSDISIEESNQTIFNMNNIPDKIKLSLQEDKDITIFEYPLDINDKDKINLLEEQISDVKLQLNASQQIRINLELQLRQKEEVLIKSQAEFSRKEQSFQKEIKLLQEKVENRSVENVDGQLKELQDMITDLKGQEAKLLTELSNRRANELEYQKIMEEYEKKISLQVTQLQKLREDHETVKCHLANLELAFSDLHQKYERSKKIIEGYKSNEDMLKEAIAAAHENVRKCDEKYETLKAHAKAQIEKSNLEIQAVREHYESEVTKLNAIVRRLEIKVNSLAESLDQKTKECVALSALCDEVTGQSVIS